MSHWKLLTAKDNGTARDVHCDEVGNLIVTNMHVHDAHAGNVFQLSTFFGGQTADDAEVNLLAQCGSTNDMHLLSVEATIQGYWELEIFEGPAFTAAGTAATVFDCNRFTANSSDVTFSNTPTLVTTTVDANSGASEGNKKVLNVTATANFVVGDWVLIEKNNEREFAEIDSIQAGSSLTMVSDMTGSYVNTDDVESCGQRMAHTHAEGGEKQKTTGAGANTGGEWIFKADEDYLLRMTNRSGAAARASNTIWWVEEAKQT